MSKHHRRKYRLKLRSLYIWHRYMGIMAAGFMLLVAVTGIFLNHTEYFELDSRHVKSDGILDWYGIQAPNDLLSFVTNERHITLMGNHLYVGELEIAGEYQRLIGAVTLDDMLLIGIDNKILLMTSAGELIEQLEEKDGVPAGMQRIGVDSAAAFIIQGSHDLYTSNDSFLSWVHWTGNSADIRWSKPVLTDKHLKKMLQYHYRGEVLPLERVMLDLHSGRFFGPLGPWLIDLSAILLILLSLTGSWMWFKRRR